MKLTKKQKAMMPAVVEEFKAIGTATGEGNQEKAFKAIQQAYINAGEKPPTKYYKYRSPIEALIGIRLYEELEGEYIEDPRAYLAQYPDLKKSVLEKNSLNKILNSFCYGNHDATWLSLYSFFKEHVGLSGLERIDPLVDTAKHCGWLSMYENVVFFQDRPEFINNKCFK